MIGNTLLIKHTARGMEFLVPPPLDVRSADRDEG